MSNEWQPIETAPKDGTRFIYCASVDAPHDLIAIGFFSEDVDIGDDGIITHWMPLPAPPSS